MRLRIRNIAFILFAVALSSCEKDRFDFSPSGQSTTVQEPMTRVDSPDVRTVTMLYSAGFNDLYNSLLGDISELERGFIPTAQYPTDPVLLVFSRNSRGVNYSRQSAPVLFRMYKKDGKVVKDTLKRWEATDMASNPAVFEDALTFMYKHYPANGYGLIFSSHATGWLPAGYYQNPSKYENSFAPPSVNWLPRLNSVSEYPEIDPMAEPRVRSIGRDENPNGSFEEMEIADMVSAIPFRLDYILFDACLMGCVEVAYALREKTDLIGFSQAEVLAAGYDYEAITGHLLKREPDPVAVCREYFEYYNANSGSAQSATISVINTRKIDALASLCKELFETYRTPISALNEDSGVQGYFRSNRHFFYDLEDILVKAGISPTDKARLDQALSDCVVYKAATPRFISFQIRTHCGLSMFLPSAGGSWIRDYYRNNVEWNTDTELLLQ